MMSGPGAPEPPSEDELVAVAMSAVAAFLEQEAAARGIKLPSRWRRALTHNLAQKNPWRSLAWATPRSWKGTR